MSVISKSDADAYDKIIEAAADLAELIEHSGIEIDELSLEELTIFLAGNAPAIRKILNKVKWP